MSALIYINEFKKTEKNEGIHNRCSYDIIKHIKYYDLYDYIYNKYKIDDVFSELNILSDDIQYFDKLCLKLYDKYKNKTDNSLFKMMVIEKKYTWQSTHVTEKNLGIIFLIFYYLDKEYNPEKIDNDLYYIFEIFRDVLKYFMEVSSMFTNNNNYLIMHLHTLGNIITKKNEDNLNEYYEDNYDEIFSLSIWKTVSELVNFDFIHQNKKHRNMHDILFLMDLVAFLQWNNLYCNEKPEDRQRRINNLLTFMYKFGFTKTWFRKN